MPKTWSLSKEDAHYKPAPQPAVRCDACKFMFPRLPIGSCKFVRGAINATYTCDHFEPRAARGKSGSS